MRRSTSAADQTVRHEEIKSAKFTNNKSVIKLNGNAIGSRTTVTWKANGESAVHTKALNGGDTQETPPRPSITAATNKVRNSLESSSSLHRTPSKNYLPGERKSLNNNEVKNNKVEVGPVSLARNGGLRSANRSPRSTLGYGKTGQQTTLVIKQNGTHGVVNGKSSDPDSVPSRLASKASEPPISQAAMLRSGSQSRLHEFRSSIPLARSSSLRSLRPTSLSSQDSSPEKPIKSLSKASLLRSASQTRLHESKSASPISRLQSLRSESMTNLSYGSQDNLNKFDASPSKSRLYKSGSQTRLNDPPKLNKLRSGSQTRLHDSKPSSLAPKLNGLKSGSQTRLHDSKPSSPAPKLNGLRSGSQTRLHNSKLSSPAPKLNGLKSGSQTRLHDSKPSSPAPKLNGLKSGSQTRLHDSKPSSPAPKLNGLKSGSQTRLHDSKPSSPAPKLNGLKSGSQTRLHDSRPSSPAPKPSKPVIKAKLGQSVSKESSKKQIVSESPTTQESVEIKNLKKVKKGKVASTYKEKLVSTITLY